MKENKGITLIALIITIVIMLILVAVSISVVINSGLLTKAGEVATMHDAKQKEEAALNGTEFDNDLVSYYLGRVSSEIDNHSSSSEIGNHANDKEYPIITLGTGANAEKFYIIKDDGTTLTLITAKNVETTNYTQSDSANTVAFDSTSPYTGIYEYSTIKNLVDNYVAALQTRTGKTISKGRLLLFDEIVAMGAYEVGDIYITSDCPFFLNSTKYWLGSSAQWMEDEEWHSQGRCMG